MSTQPGTRIAGSRRDLFRWLAIVGGAAAASRLVPATGASAAEALPDTILAVMNKPRYTQATWNLLVEDLATGETLYELRPDQLALTGSVRKLFSVGLALDQLGADHRCTTTVYRQGEIDDEGVLDGNLILVAGGDLTFGGRLRADDSIEYTDFDHNDANNLGTALLTPQDPLYGLDSLAQQIAAAGIRLVSGDVIVDDRLFEPFRVPNQNLLITPIMVNENMIDITVAPTQPGEAAVVDYRPVSAAFAVSGAVTTGPAESDETVSLSGGGLVECIGTADCGGTVDGSIPLGYRAPLSDSPALVQTFRIEDPAAFARTALIEALARAAVPVAAPAVAPNPRSALPEWDAYAPENLLAEFDSPEYQQAARLILKVSLNLGANLSMMHVGVANGQRTVAGALAAERRLLVERMGVSATGFAFPTNGSGSPDSQATPRAVARLLAAMANSDVGPVYRDCLPILGVDGSLASTGVDLPARGHAFAKTGTTLADGALKAQNLAGYIDAKSGRRLAFALFVNDAGPISRIEDISEVFDDQATIVNLIYDAS